MRKQSGRSAPSSRVEWKTILEDAVSKPGVISDAYSQFWSYSIGNQLLAMFQCLERGIPLGPIHTFRGWERLGRRIKRGEKAIVLCMPINVSARRGAATTEEQQDSDAGVEAPSHGDKNTKRLVTIYTFKPRWFVLSQTEGEEYAPMALPEWREDVALERLSVERITFEHPNGNVQGFATKRGVSVSPIAFLPHKTLFHELAHVLLGHTREGMLDDHERTPVSIREVEAECVALICCEALRLSGAEFCRGYIQHWLRSEKIPERSAQKIFRAADEILEAGRPGIAREETSE